MHEIEAWLKRYKMEGKFNSLILRVHPSLGEKLNQGFISTLKKIQLKYFVKITLDQSEKINPQHFRFVAKKTNEDITDEFA